MDTPLLPKHSTYTDIAVPTLEGPSEGEDVEARGVHVLLVVELREEKALVAAHFELEEARRPRLSRLFRRPWARPSVPVLVGLFGPPGRGGERLGVGPRLARLLVAELTAPRVCSRRENDGAVEQKKGRAKTREEMFVKRLAENTGREREK
mgnify:CR=1 FL=1